MKFAQGLDALLLTELEAAPCKSMKICVTLKIQFVVFINAHVLYLCVNFLCEQSVILTVRNRG